MKRLVLATFCLLLLAAPSPVRAEEIPQTASSPVPPEVKAEIEKAMAANTAQKAENERQAGLLIPEGERLGKEAEEITTLQKEIGGTCPGVVFTPGATPGPTTPQCQKMVDQLNAKIDVHNAASSKFVAEMDKLKAKEDKRIEEAAALIERMRSWGEFGGTSISAETAGTIVTCKKECEKTYAYCHYSATDNCARPWNSCMNVCDQVGKFDLNKALGSPPRVRFHALPE